MKNTFLNISLLIPALLLISLCSYSQETLWKANGNDVYFINGKVGIGIGTALPTAELTVGGTVHAKEIVVELTIPGPDYVFDDSYSLMPLSELEIFIIKNKHLPDIPSGLDIKSKGISISEMSMLLLKKSEELTLYIIDHEKRITKLTEVIP